MPHARRGNASPLLLGAAGLLAGAAVGYAVKHLTTDPVAIVVQQPEVVKQELSPEELENLCSEPLDDERMNLAKAQAKVVDLQAQLQARESELGKLKGQVEVDEQKRAAAARRWKEMESEIEQLKTDLAQAESERDEVMVELKTTIRKLERQIRETEKAKAEADFYKNESTVNLWSAFVAQAKVEICDRGTRKRHEKCHEAVAGALDKMSKDRFRECVDTYQATPVLIQAEEWKNMELPPYSEWLNEDDRYTKKGWYVQYCDPTLPEAKVGDNSFGGIDLELDPDELDL